MNNEIVIKEIDYRPCYVNGKKALFHKYIETTNIVLNKVTQAIVEYEDGQVGIVLPASIKFCDNLISQYAFKNDEKSDKDE